MKIKKQNPVQAAIKLIVMDGYYVRGVRCGMNHSGNDRLSGPTNGYYECQGCGRFSGAEHVLTTQRGPVEGCTGQGGIYRIA